LLLLSKQAASKELTVITSFYRTVQILTLLVFKAQMFASLVRCRWKLA